MRDIFRPGKADPRRNQTAGFIGLGPSQHAKSNLPGAQRGDAGTAGNELAARWQNRGNCNKILLLDVGVAQSMLERRKLLAMPTNATRQKHPFWNRKHCSFLSAGKPALCEDCVTSDDNSMTGSPVHPSGTLPAFE